MKPAVFKDAGIWVAALDHGTWLEETDFETWDRAIDHALWLGLTAGVWSA